MSTYASPTLAIDFSQLPTPEVVETVAYEDLLSAYKARVLAINPALSKALRLEQSATNIILETEAYGELLVRARVNAAARAVLLAFATGGDLDHLGALYNLPRDTNPDGTPETDTRFRVRIQLCPESFATAGSSGAYKFQALTADPTIRDATAIKADDKGTVRVTLMASGDDPIPTDAQIQAVTQRLYQTNIKPLTDVVKVSGVTVFPVKVSACIALYSGPDQGIVIANVKAALDSLRSRIAMIGRDLTRAALISALNQEGVQNVDLRSPQIDIVCDDTQCARIVGGFEVTVSQARKD